MNNRKKTNWILLGVLFFLIACTVTFFGVGFAVSGDSHAAAPLHTLKPAARAPTAETLPTEKPAGEKPTIGLVTNTNGLGDASINDSAWQGLCGVNQSLGLYTPLLIESASENDYVNNVEEMSSRADLTIAVGPDMEAAIREAAQKHPDRKFACTHCIVDLPNVVSNLFNGNEGCFLLGIAAVMSTQSNVIGFIGGEALDFVLADEAGFRAGVKSVNPDAKVISKYIDSWTDTEAFKNACGDLAGKGTDIYFAFAGEASYPIFIEDKIGDFRVIGVDIGNAVPTDKVLCSLSWNDGYACGNAVKDFVFGKFEGGTRILGIQDDGVYVTLYGHLDQKAVEAMDAYKEAFLDGRLTIPASMDELENFTPPVI
jgi:basic membrane protein A and related proteins